jgi:DNA-binding transcriptional ArsR family regulator
VITYLGEELAALADPTRRAIFEVLADGPRPVGEIASHFPVTRPAVSQHLKVLKDAGLVIDRASGTRRLYQLNPERVAALRGYFDQFWSRSLAAFKVTVEQSEQENP